MRPLGIIEYQIFRSLFLKIKITRAIIRYNQREWKEFS